MVSKKQGEGRSRVCKFRRHAWQEAGGRGTWVAAGKPKGRGGGGLKAWPHAEHRQALRSGLCDLPFCQIQVPSPAMAAAVLLGRGQALLPPVATCCLFRELGDVPGGARPCCSHQFSAGPSRAGRLDPEVEAVSAVP
jgi:hypothetical protein